MKKEQRSGWWWVPTLYYAEGIPYIIAMTVSVVMYKTMGISNAVFAFWTSILYLPWVAKFAWAPIIDIYATKRRWIIIMQAVLGVLLLGVAIVMQFSWFFVASLIFLWFLAFASATHDIACDGLYMLALDSHDQSWFVGIRSTFYRFAMLTGQGLLVILAGYIESNTGLPPVELTAEVNSQTEKIQMIHPDSLDTTEKSGTMQIIIIPQAVSIPVSSTDSAHIYVYLSRSPQEGTEVVVNFGRREGRDLSLITPGRMVFTGENWNIPVKQSIVKDPKLKEASSALFIATSGNTPLGWSVTFVAIGFMFIIFFVYHQFILPYPKSDIGRQVEGIFDSFKDVMRTFFQKKQIAAGIAFLLLYRLAESQLVKLATPFLLDAQEAGGLALTTGQVGIAYGTVGMIGLTLGGILGGFAAARHGLKTWIWWMAVAINLPDLVYVYLSYVQPYDFKLINTCIFIEQFGYGFGFTGYMLYMIFISEGEYKTSHFAITTAFMALGMMIPGMVSGYIQEWIGYQNFFVWVMIATIPSFVVLKFIHINPEFGKKSDSDL
jgi:PAT family beta-lactamase induction signal transducer AmpG